jgi:hypothetical protein
MINAYPIRVPLLPACRAGGPVWSCGTTTIRRGRHSGGIWHGYAERGGWRWSSGGMGGWRLH